MIQLLTKIVIATTLTVCGSSDREPIPWTVDEKEIAIGIGIQPAVTVDSKGFVQIVYGRKINDDRQLFISTSHDGVQTFTQPKQLGSFTQMGLGMGRGPQIVNTGDFTTITVNDHLGNMYAIRSSTGSNQWSNPVRVNDIDTTAKEALSGLAYVKDNEVYSVWLDTRLGNNNLYGASSKDGGLTWEKNQLIYKGEQEGICDCCKPSVISDGKGKITVMFRNKLSGARNMYLLSSTNGGNNFTKAEKLGTGDFMINGCPMDGGSLTSEDNGKVLTVWRRQMQVYMAEPGKPEIKLGEGKTPSIIQSQKGPVIVWNQDGKILLSSPGRQSPRVIANGQYPKLAVSSNHKDVICVFEREGQVFVKSIEI